MNKRLLLLLFSIFFISYCSKLEAKSVPDGWTTDYKSAIKTAKKEKKMVLLNFTGSDWCGYCIQMEKNVFTTKEWKEFAKKNLVSVFVDFPRNKEISSELKKANQKLQQKYQIRGFPTFILLDGNEKYLETLGYKRDTKNFIKSVEIPLYASDDFIKNKKVSEENKDKYNMLKKDYNSSKSDVQKWLATRPERNEENNKKYAEFNKEINDSATKLYNFCKTLNL